MASANSGWHCKNCGHSYAVGQISHRIPQHLVTTNNPPSETELISLNDILPAATVEVAQELATLNDDIEALQKTLETLKARRPELEARFLGCKSIMSPLRRVPPEVVREIIGWATIGEPVTLDTEEGIWSYSRVSHMWCSVALSMPVFWSTIYITVPFHFPPSSYEHMMECVRTILSRIKTHSLSFDFQYREYDQFTVRQALELIEPFIQCAPQWCKVSLIIPDNNEFVWALSSIMDHVACLEDLYLELHKHGYGSNWRDGKPVVCFRNAPALRRVSFNIPNRPLTDFLPWVQITEYKTNSSNSWEYLELMPNLLDLQLKAQHLYPSQLERKLELKKLRRLDVSWSKDVIQCLTLPALQDVTVCLENAELLAVIDLIKRSECCITMLILKKQTWQKSIGDTDILAELFKCVSTHATIKVIGGSEETTTTIFNLQRGLFRTDS